MLSMRQSCVVKPRKAASNKAAAQNKAIKMSLFEYVLFLFVLSPLMTLLLTT